MIISTFIAWALQRYIHSAVPGDSALHNGQWMHVHQLHACRRVVTGILEPFGT